MEHTRRRQQRPETVLNWPYARDAGGVWRYPWGDAVPGARDCTLLDVLGLAPVDEGGRQVVLVPAELWEADQRLTWTGVYWDPRSRDKVIRVPLEAWAQHDEVVTLMAPELLPSQLLDITAVAELYGCSPATARNYVTRGVIPRPVAKLGASPVWTRPVILRAVEEYRQGLKRRPKSKRLKLVDSAST